MKLYEVQRMGKKSAIRLYFNDGTELLISYSTIVGVRFPDGRMYITRKKWSQTTDNHISWWQYAWGHPHCERVSQEYLDNLLTVDPDKALASLLAA